MPLGVLESFRFNVSTDMGKQRRVGYQIGRFAVYESINGEHLNKITAHMPRPVYVVVHVPTGVTLFYVQTPEEALLLADDVSRFCAKDPSAKDPRKATTQFGPNILRWAKAQFNNGLALRRVQGFRAFMAD